MLTQICNRKRKDSFQVIVDNLSSLILRQNLKSDSFLKVSYCVKSDTTSVNF